ncbi:MAG: hypothetical protein SFW35_09430 [Chitinophagales bacterium]|nr:hypothetical protein [Chitinophagales bacterium]
MINIAKVLKPHVGTAISDEDEWEYTYYLRDASGNVMSNYTKRTLVSTTTYKQVKQTEVPLYGSDRLGIFNRNKVVGKLEVESDGSDGPKLRVD